MGKSGIFAVCAGLRPDSGRRPACGRQSQEIRPVAGAYWGSKFQPNRTSQDQVIYFVVYWCAIVIFWCHEMWVVFKCRDDCSLQISAESDFTGSSYRLCGILVRHRNILVWWNVGGFRMSRLLLTSNFSPIGSQMLKLRHVRYSIGYILYLKIRFFGHKYRNMQIQKILGHMDLETRRTQQFH